MNLRKTSFDS